jgi:hypothetical protein
MRIPLVSLWILINVSLYSCKTLRPIDYYYQIVDGRLCSFDKIEDLQSKKSICKDLKDFDSSWLLVNKQKWKEILTQGVDDMLVQKLPEKPK